MNFSIAAIAYWAVGFALAFGGAGLIAGDHAFFLNVSGDPAEAAAQIPKVAATIEAYAAEIEHAAAALEK